MKLYVIRHGQSATNLSGHYTGWEQIPLTEKGIEDAKAIRPLLSEVRFDKVYSSDLIRAKTTAVTALPGCKFEETPLLREINVGSLANQPLSSITETEKELTCTEGFGKYGGETRDEMRKRIEEFLKLLESNGHECIAAFSHAGFLRTMLEMIIGCYIPRNTLLCANCTVAIFEFKNEKWMLHSWINP